MNAQNTKKTRPHGHPERAPDDWVTGSAPMTVAQASYLKRLCEHAGEAFEAKLSKAEASKRIDALRVPTVLVRRAS